MTPDLQLSGVSSWPERDGLCRSACRLNCSKARTLTQAAPGPPAHSEGANEQVHSVKVQLQILNVFGYC